MANNTPLSFEERKKIENLLKHYPSYSLSQISIRINRGKNTVICEVRKNGGRENYTAEKGQQKSYETHQRKIQRLKTINAFTDPNRPIRDKIDALSMQIEILFDMVKELQQNRGKND